MKKYLIIIAVLISSLAYSQGSQTTYTVTSIANMKTYSGQSSRIHVTATNEDFVNSPASTPDEVTIYDGAGTRVWKKVIDPTKQPLDADLTTIAGLTATTNNFITSVSSAWASRTPAQVKTTLSLDNVDNTADASKTFSASQITSGVFDVARLPEFVLSSTFFSGAATAGDPIVPIINTSPTDGSLLPVTSNAVFDGLALKANLASPTFTGTATFPTPFTLGATSVTSTGTQLNYLNAASGTTGTGSVVFSASPTFTGLTIIPAFKTVTTATAGNIQVGTSDGITTNSAVSQLLFSGAAAVDYRISERGGFNTTLTANAALGSHIIGIQAFTEAGSGSHPMVSQLVVNPLVGTNGAGATTDAATVFINGPMTGVTPSGRNDAFRVSGTSLFGSITLGTAGDKINITEGSNGSVGQIALISGTRAITISGVSTASRAFVTLVTPSGTTNTVTYQAVCTANTLTLRANIAAGTINTADASTLNYFVIN